MKIYSYIEKGKIFLYAGSRNRSSEMNFDKIYSYVWQLFKMGLVGGFGVGINLGLLYLLTDIVGIFYMISSCISWITNSIILYILNSFFTFKKWMGFKGWLKYITATTVTNVIYLILLYGFTEYLHIYYLFSSVIAIVLCFLGNFFLVGKAVWNFGKVD